jgi:hypothetical protein
MHKCCSEHKSNMKVFVIGGQDRHASPARAATRPSARAGACATRKTLMQAGLRAMTVQHV